MPQSHITDINEHTVMKQRKGLSTHRLSELKKKTFWASVGSASDKHQAPTHRLKICQCHHWVWGLTHRHLIKEETIAINRDWVYNKTCRLPHNKHVYHSFIMLDDLFKLIMKRGLSNDSTPWHHMQKADYKIWACTWDFDTYRTCLSFSHSLKGMATLNHVSMKCKHLF